MGWAVFGISALVYFITVERTASFWDCGEFIACSYKLQVPHPPGAPLFLLIGRMFSLLATDVSMVAFWINISSVLSSAFTILFLFWSITLFGAKLLPERSIKNLTDAQIIALMGAGLVGSLAYTFSDSFWFSAVEAEVYAMSSFFTAFVVWAMLKWELIEDESLANRWLILMAYMMGLSIGVHLLNLVTIPALGLIYYYKKFKEPTPTGIIATLAISGVIIIFILEGIIPGLASLAGNFEIFFVNTLRLPFGSGAIFISIVLVSALSYGIYYSIIKEKVVLNTALLSLTMILIGYASYGIILIRSTYNPPINENDPSDVIRFVSYLKREQYGDRPLLYGPTFTSSVKRDSEGAAVQKSKGKLYRVNKEKQKYEVYDERFAYEFEDNMLLPRIYSRVDNHQELYKQWIFGDRPLPEGYKPTMKDNLYFLFRYQFGHMYWRYFLWNFVGRESDVEGSGSLSPFASNRGIPEELATNKAHNQFYMLPLILGLLGLFFTFQRSQQTFFITLMLFFLTGMALVLYLNSPPVEPRERDYIYAGSFYAFAMWIGFGVLMLVNALQNLIKNSKMTSIVATGLGLLVPGIMLAEGWDDHNRSNRYHSVDSAKNLLNSCAPNAVLFTGGDNDTFPLWYVQEVEGFRTDVRVCNLSLLGTDWYISQMKRPTYESEALPISLEYEQFIQGTNDQILFPPSWRITTNLPPKDVERMSKSGMDLKGYIKLVKEGDRRIKAFAPGSNEDDITILPSKKLVLKIDQEKVRKIKGLIPKDKDTLLTNTMSWELGANELYKNDLIILDMIATNDWTRPIYFSTTLANSSYLNLKPYMQREGLAFRLLPIKVEGAAQGYVNTDIMYDNMMNKFFWRELDNPNSYYDENYKRFVLNLRDSFYRLADQLIAEGKEEKAKKVLLFALEKMPDKAVPYDVYSTQLVEGLFKVGEDKKALEIAQTMGNRAIEMLEYKSKTDQMDEQSDRVRLNLAILNQIAQILKEEGKTKEAKKFEDSFKLFYNQISN